MRNLMSRVVSGLLALAFCGIAHGFFFPQLGIQLSPQIKSGTVMTRAQVLGDNGGPILVVTRTTGNASSAKTDEIEEIGEIYAEGPLGKVYILSGAEVGYFLDKTARLRIERGDTMKRAIFLDPEALTNGIKVANGDMSEPVNLPDSVKTVLVLGERDRFGTDPSRWTLVEFPFLMDEKFTLEDNASSVLFDEEGAPIRTVFGTSDEDGNYAVEQFTYRVGYWGEGADAMVQDADGYAPRGDDRIFGPVSGAELSMASNSGMSGADGRYQLFYMHYCLGLQTDGGFLPLTGPTAATINLVLKASIYNPRGKAYFPLLMQRQTEFFCGPVGATADHNFIVDLLWLSGKLRLANTANGATLPIGDDVLYQGEDRQGDAMAQSRFDFDGDGEPDISVHANKKTATDDEGNSYVIPDQEGEPDSKRWQAVYFSSGSHRPDAESLPEQVPDLWRLADHALDAKETGLYSQITQDVLVNTDLYVFRDSTGELIVELNGLPDGIADGADLTENGDYFAFNTVMRGPKQLAIHNGVCKGQRGDDCLLRTLYDGSGDADRALLATNTDEAYQRDAEQLGFQSRYQQRDGGLPAPGEWMTVVALNRTTGYTGTVRFQLGQPYGEGAIGANITQRVPDITLTPPNLKVWAKRVYDIDKGLTKDETVNYLIGHEGAATQNDTLVGIYTEWLDSDGRPLPAGLDIDQGKDFGLSGRLAKISGDELVPVSSGLAVEAGDFDIEEAQQGSQIAEFPIGPGQRLQLLRLKADNTSNEHYYVNVFGRAINKEACPHCEYTEADKHEDLLTGRPNHYTPFYVPRYDEQATLELKLERNKLRVEEAEAQEDGEAPPDDEDKLGKVTAQYDWMLRPEYQFTLLDIEVNELNAIRKQTNEDGSEEEIVRNLIDEDQPVITSSDDLIRLLYNLILPEDDALQSLDGPREYVLALGEEEIRITVGEDQTIDIENLDHLASLDVEDFLTMRLYLSNDQENVLWQWAFEYSSVFARQEDIYDSTSESYYYISADDIVVPLGAVISGTEIDQLAEPRLIEWEVDGDGVISEPIQEALANSFSVDLTMPTTAGSHAKIRAKLSSGESNVFGTVMVIPGEPRFITVETLGRAYTNGVGEVQVSATVYDMNGNTVLDGTAVDFFSSGSGSFTSEGNVTRSGKVSGVLKGGTQAGESTLTISAGQASSSASVQVDALSLTLESDSSQQSENTSQVITAKISGALSEGVPVTFFSSSGAFEEYGVTETDASGEATILWDSGSLTGAAEIYACAGFDTCSSSMIINVVAPPTVAEAVFVSHRTDNGSIDVPTLGGSSASYAYLSSYLLSTAGGTQPGDTLRIGSAYKPNRPSILSMPWTPYYRDTVHLAGSDFPIDVKGVNWAEVDDAVLVRKYPELSSAQSITLPLSEPLTYAAINFKAKIDAVSGALFAAQGAVRVGMSGNAMTAQFSGLNGVVSLSAPLQYPEGWHEYSIHYSSDMARIYVDDVLIASADSTGPLQASGSTMVFAGSPVTMAELYIYDLAGAPLYTFADTGFDTYTFGEGEAPVSLTIQKSSSDSGRDYIDYVPVKGDAGDTQAIFYALSELATENSLRWLGGEPIDDVRLLAVAKDCLRYGSERTAIEQGVSAYRRQFDKPSLLMEALMLRWQGHPANRELRSSLDVIDARLSVLPDDAKMSLSGEMASSFSALDEDKVTSGRKLQLFIKAMGEMSVAERAATDVILSHINNVSDLNIWLELMAMPGKGWVGYRPPAPHHSSDCNLDYPSVQVAENITLPLVSCRTTGYDIANFVEFVSSQSIDAERLLPAMRMVLDLAPLMPLEWRPFSMRTGVVNTQAGRGIPGLENAHAAIQVAPILALFARLGVKVSVGAVKNVVAYVMDRTNSRIDPFWVFGSYFYLDSRLPNEDDSCGENCKPLNSPLFKDKIDNMLKNSLLAMAYRGKFTDPAQLSDPEDLSCRIWETSHGMQYELYMAAYFHAMNEFGGDERYTITGLQVQHDVIMVKVDASRNPTEDYPSIKRFTDIELKGDGVKPTYVELKSAQARYTKKPSGGGQEFKWTKFKKKYPLWSGRANKNTSFHRQLLVDNLMTNAYKLADGEQVPSAAKSYIWLWQDWKRKAPRRYTRARDPGVSIWRQKTDLPNKPGGGVYATAGDALRGHMDALGSQTKAENSMRYMLGSANAKGLGLNKLTWMGAKRFDQLDPTDNVLALLQPALNQFFDPGLQDWINDAKEAGDRIQSRLEVYQDALEQFRRWVGKEIPSDWRTEMEEQIDRALEELELAEQKVDEFTGDMLPEDLITTECF